MVISVCATRRKITHEMASAAVTGHARDDIDEFAIFNTPCVATQLHVRTATRSFEGVQSRGQRDKACHNLQSHPIECKTLQLFLIPADAAAASFSVPIRTDLERQSFIHLVGLPVPASSQQKGMIARGQQFIKQIRPGSWQLHAASRLLELIT